MTKSSDTGTSSEGERLGIVDSLWRTELFPLPTPKEVIRQFLQIVLDVYAHDRIEGVLSDARLHTHRITQITSEGVWRYNTPELTEAIIDAVVRINQQWPGAFRPLRPISPRLDNPGRILWIADSTALWSWANGRFETPREFMEVALGLQQPVFAGHAAGGAPPRHHYGIAGVSKHTSATVAIPELMKQVLAKMTLQRKPDPIETDIRAYSIYQHSIPLRPGTVDTVRSTPAQAAAVVAGIERLNTRYPGAFREVRPSIPEPDSDDRILWIYEPRRIGSDPGRTDPTLDELVDVAMKEGAD